MLVLSRKLGEQIRIGADVVVTVTRIEGHRVCLGIAAPQDVHILRAELEPVSDETRAATEGWGRSESRTSGESPGPRERRQRGWRAADRGSQNERTQGPLLSRVDVRRLKAVAAWQGPE